MSCHRSFGKNIDFFELWEEEISLVFRDLSDTMPVWATDGTLSDVQTQILEPRVAIRDDAETRYWPQRILRYMDDLLVARHERFTPERIDQVIRPVYEERSGKMALSFFEEIEARGKAEMILTFLRKNSTRVPKRIKHAVRQMTDPVALDSLAAHLVDCQTLDKFAEALK